MKTTKKESLPTKKELLNLKKAMFNYDSKITEKPIPTKKEREMVVDYFKQQGFELYKTETLKPKLDKLALIEEQVQTVKNYEECLKNETNGLLNLVKTGTLFI